MRADVFFEREKAEFDGFEGGDGGEELGGGCEHEKGVGLDGRGVFLLAAVVVEAGGVVVGECACFLLKDWCFVRVGVNKLAKI